MKQNWRNEFSNFVSAKNVWVLAEQESNYLHVEQFHYLLAVGIIIEGNPLNLSANVRPINDFEIIWLLHTKCSNKWNQIT